MKRTLVPITLLLLLVAGCGAGAGEAPTAAATTVMQERTALAPLATATPVPAPPEATETEEAAAVGEEVQRLVREDLSQRLDVSVTAIEIVSVQAVTWDDASFGCALPGIDYVRANTPGFKIVAEVEGEQYRYHTDEGQRAVLCAENDMPVLPTIPVKPGEIKDGSPWMPVGTAEPGD